MVQIADTFEGVAQGIGLGQRQEGLGIQQKSLLLQQQAQENQQHRELLARADKQRSDLMGLASETIQHLKLAGKDNASIAKAVQPIVQAAKRLAQSSGVDPAMIDAQLATTLAQPGNPQVPGAGGGQMQVATATQAAPSSPSIGGPSPLQPTSNLTDPNTTITGIDYGSVQNLRNGQPVGESPAPQEAFNAPAVTATTSAAPPAAPPMDEVTKWTNYMTRLRPDTPAATREVALMRLKEAMRQQTGGDVEVKAIKDESGNDHVVFIDKKNRTVTDSNGQPYVTPGATGGEETDAQAIARAIKDGSQPPVLTGLYKNAKPVRAALAREGFDLTKAQMEYDGAKKQIQSLNGPQMIRYAGLAKSVVNTIDEVKSLSREMENSGIPLLNAAKIQAYIQTQGNSPNGQLAARYMAGINTLKEEFANLAQGGYAPTEAAWDLAKQQINGNYGVKQLEASLNEVQRLIRYRLNGIPNFGTLGPNAPNRYFPAQQGEAPAPAAPASGDGWKIEKIN